MSGTAKSIRIDEIVIIYKHKDKDTGWGYRTVFGSDVTVTSEFLEDMEHEFADKIQEQTIAKRTSAKKRRR